MKQWRYPVRMNTPQRLDYVFRDLSDAVIDLTSYLSVSLLVKREGEELITLVADFGTRTAGAVFYDAYQFLTEGSWTAQFVALNAASKPVYGEPVRMTVVKNVDDLALDELPVL